MKYLNKFSIALIGIFTSFSSHALVYDETLDGPLSNDPTSISTIQFDAGSNSVSGLVDNFTFGGGDFFSFTLREGETLTAVNLLNYSPFTFDFATPSGFFGIGDFTNAPRLSNNIAGLDPGDENTELFNASLFTQNDLGPIQGPHFNLLDLASRTSQDEEGAALEFISGFSGILGPGSYWVWLSETSGEFTYELEFLIDAENVVATPIPASVLLLLGPLGFVLRSKKSTS